MAIITVGALWESSDQSAWDRALARYWCFVKPGNVALEVRLGALQRCDLWSLDGYGWYEFLRDGYFRWKYTAPNRYASTSAQLRRHCSKDGLAELETTCRKLLRVSPDDISGALQIALQIHGLGTAGASGLLALMYPTHFATVDQFVVKALRDVDNLPEAVDLNRMKETGLSITDGVMLIEIMRRKAAENSLKFRPTQWTPRMIDMVLWTYGRSNASCDAP